LEDSVALAVEGLTVQYSGFLAVSEVDLEVPRGDIRGLIGPNGAGKTSCFNGICGYVRPSGGTIRVDGRQVRLNNPYAAWKAGIGRTFQRVELFWSLQVRDHFELAHRRALKRGIDSPTWEDLSEFLNLADLETEMVANLPIGTCRLVELGRAISTGANLILLDEPCSGLDRQETDQLEAALRRIQEELGLSLLIVEHDMDFILSIARRVYVMNYGQVIAEGSPAEIRKSPEVHEAYLGGTPDEIEVPISSNRALLDAHDEQNASDYLLASEADLAL
jgi:ABC-type branched-subunit amino acid transport system ATPase component